LRNIFYCFTVRHWRISVRKHWPNVCISARAEGLHYLNYHFNLCDTPPCVSIQVRSETKVIGCIMFHWNLFVDKKTRSFERIQENVLLSRSLVANRRNHLSADGKAMWKWLQVEREKKSVSLSTFQLENNNYGEKLTGDKLNKITPNL
jgi:hypothetical protein